MSSLTNASATCPPTLPTARLGAMRAISALILREMGTRYGRTPGGYLWALVEPLGMIILLAFAWSLLAKSPSLGTSFLLFKATGLLILTLATQLANLVGRAMLFSKALLFYPRITWIDAVLARFILNALVLCTVMSLILTGIVIYEGITTVLSWDRIALAVGFSALLGLGVGCLNCYLFQRFAAWQTAWAILTRPLFLISGVIVVYEDMPALAQAVLWFNPVLHLTGIMRDGFYPTYAPQYISITYLAVWIVVPMVIGLLLLRQYHRDLLNR